MHALPLTRWIINQPQLALLAQQGWWAPPARNSTVVWTLDPRRRVLRDTCGCVLLCNFVTKSRLAGSWLLHGYAVDSNMKPRRVALTRQPDDYVSCSRAAIPCSRRRFS